MRRCSRILVASRSFALLVRPASVAQWRRRARRTRRRRSGGRERRRSEEVRRARIGMAGTRGVGGTTRIAMEPAAVAGVGPARPSLAATTTVEEMIGIGGTITAARTRVGTTIDETTAVIPATTTLGALALALPLPQLATPALALVPLLLLPAAATTTAIASPTFPTTASPTPHPATTPLAQTAMIARLLPLLVAQHPPPPLPQQQTKPPVARRSSVVSPRCSPMLRH